MLYCGNICMRICVYYERIRLHGNLSDYDVKMCVHAVGTCVNRFDRKFAAEQPRPTIDVDAHI